MADRIHHSRREAIQFKEHDEALRLASLCDPEAAVMEYKKATSKEKVADDK